MVFDKMSKPHYVSGIKPPRSRSRLTDKLLDPETVQLAKGADAVDLPTIIIHLKR